MPHGLWDLSSRPGTEPRSLPVKVPSPDHWSTGLFTAITFLLALYVYVYIYIYIYIFVVQQSFIFIVQGMFCLDHLHFNLKWNYMSFTRWQFIIFYCGKYLACSGIYASYS